VIGVLGGSGFYEFFDDPQTRSVATPYGPPAADPVVGDVEGVEVAFIPRHGVDHQFPPHLVPFRANIWALKELGVDRIVSASAVGSLLVEYAPGDFAIPDQIVDRTWGRSSTFHEGPETHHLSFADPYHPGLRAVALEGMESTGATVHDGGTVVVVQGPRFSTRAESASFVASGWELINMTQMPETCLAAEAGIAVANISVITDYDVGIGDAPPVTHEEVIRRFGESVGTLKAGLRAMLPLIEKVPLTE
jgi:5'-methylthioadenosine phosphorylase